jgi:predicted 2-oxoglutarate/Fe(II)-dependent dioxygenase YbiX
MLITQEILFTKEDCDNILTILKENEIKWKSSDREYNSYDLNANEHTLWLFDRLKTFFENKTKLQIYKLKEQIHFHKYTIGNRFDRHNDNRDERMYSIGVLLNDEFVGGDFILYNNTEIVLNKIIGNAYIFDVNIEHEITPIINGERYSLLWFLQREHIKPKIKGLI